MVRIFSLTFYIFEPLQFQIPKHRINKYTSFRIF